MTAHPFTIDEEIAGDRQAENFLQRVHSGEPLGVDDLSAQFELARMSSMARARGFAARIQQQLSGGAGRGTD